ncbi:XRE family transcriptional regulator [Exilibacterium tricleocarpae]|uniref:XRE family transcriptional regulator n=1 Tax=Exilibacterium tricleocarpae TaxID=2591008 RepID=A0A545TFH9_9GAMM|nr:helix-turn-helix domain-containing protein [Exilibacterium tricleocarpae]TQV75992.1 XRE family transcriptional regulator [Exilibacterium tricleocarpae]
MAQVAAIVDALKSVLKAHKLKYRDVAVTLELSEASVKRLFRTCDFDLAQLEKICHMMEIEISDLIQMMAEQQAEIQELTEQQEQEIAGDLALLMITVCVLNRWSLEDILSFYRFSETECIQRLAHLDRLRIIELLPKNRIKLLVAPNFSWRKGGPIQTFFLQTIEKELFRARFDKENHKLLVLNGMLSDNANREFQGKMDRLAREFDRLNDTDAGLALGKRHGTTVVLAMRDWQYDIFKPLRRDAE